MPSRFVFTFTYKTYIEVGCYIALLFFMVPIQIEKDYETRKEFRQYLQDFNKSYPDGETLNLRFSAFKVRYQFVLKQYIHNLQSFYT